jgi:hypothetical protein
MDASCQAATCYKWAYDILAPFLFRDGSYLRAWLSSDENEVSSAPRSVVCNLNHVANSDDSIRVTDTANYA